MSKNKMAVKVAVSLMGAVSIGIVFFYIIFIITVENVENFIFSLFINLFYQLFSVDKIFKTKSFTQYLYPFSTFLLYLPSLC